MNSVIIRPATADDVPAVIRIATEHDLGGKSPERVRAEGFLVSAYPAALYLRLLKHLSVATVDGEVAAFTLTFPSDEVPPEVTDGERIVSVIGNSPYFLIKQVGVAIKQQKTGLARAMYQKHLAGLQVPAFAPIVLAPANRNIVSIAFHEKMGFRQVETLKDAQGQDVSGLWCKQPVPA
ncbi:MAG: GNAT family N-acetyltransferase [Prosthecobacter sp.]